MSPYRFRVTRYLWLISATILLCPGCHSSRRPVSTSQTEPSKKVETRATFLAVGDIMLSRGVAQRIASANDPLLPFRHLETLLKSTDFNFGNLERWFPGKDQALGHDKIFNAKDARH